MKISGRLLGGKALANTLKDLSKLNSSDVEKGLFICAYRVHREAVISISRGPARTGRIYRKGTKRQHRASAAGEPPKTDTGILVNSLFVKVSTPTAKACTAIVGSGLLYAKHLEFGTQKMGARPWLLPAFEKTKKENEKTLTRVLKEEVNKRAREGKGSAG